MRPEQTGGAGCCPSGPRGLRGPSGATGVSGEESCTVLTLSDRETNIAGSGAGEVILFEYEVNFGAFSIVDFPQIGIFFAALADTSAPGGTVRLRAGATNPGSTLGSTIVGCRVVNETSSSFEFDIYGLLTNDAGTTLIQITAQAAGGSSIGVFGQTTQFTCPVEGRAADTC